MASGKKDFPGSFVGTGALVTINKVGFRPAHVRLFNVNSDDQAEWIEGMADGTMVKRLKAGGASLIASPNGITPLANGFSLGADADINVAGEVVHFIAFE